MPIPTPRVELQQDGSWEDITGRAYHRDPIEISTGRRAEGSRADPTDISLTINNRDGEFSDLNPLSPRYGKLTPNTPIRVAMPGSESYLRLDRTTTGIATTPDTAALDITGDIDVRVELTARNWYTTNRQTLIGKWSQTDSGQRSWFLRIGVAIVTFVWTTGGTNATQHFVEAPLPGGLRRAALRATLDVNNGSGGHTATLYWAPSMDGPWTTLFTATGSGITSVYASTSPLTIGPTDLTSTPNRLPLDGRIHRAEVRNGIGGAVVAAPDLRALAEGTTAWTDSAGRAWSLSGTAEITRSQYRGAGEIESWPSRWTLSGADAWVPVRGRGVLERLSRTSKPLDSTLRRRIPTFSPLAYWPMEEGEEATQIYSPIAGVSPLKYSGLTLANDDTLPGSAPLPTTAAYATLSARVPRSAAVGWHVELVYKAPTLPAGISGDFLRVQIAGSAVAQFIVKAGSTGIRLDLRDADDVLLATNTWADPAPVAAFQGRWNRLQLFTAQDGANTRFYAAWLDVEANTWYYLPISWATTAGQVTWVHNVWDHASWENLSIGHLAVFPTPATYSGGAPSVGTMAFDNADNGLRGETALDRLARLTAEEAVPFSWVDGDTTASSEQLGPQRVMPLLELLEEAADVDGGMLGEDPERLGLHYRDRMSLYNQTPALTLDYAGGQVAPPLEPVRDTQRVVNDVEVKRVNGSSARAVLETGRLSVQAPPHGIGRIDQAPELNVFSDDQVAPQAGWRLHLGTVEEARYPSVTVYLHQQPDLIDDVLALRPGDLLRITNLPVWAGGQDVDLVVEGWHETIQAPEWTITFACSPASPWSVGILDDPILGRIDTDGSSLVSGVSASATSLTVASDQAPWTTDPADCPFDIRVGGEVMTVTSITGAASPQTFTVVRAVNGISKSQTAGTDVRLATPTIIAL
ncbi:hypothetical protein [Streptomyces sp. NPDC051310]|uniref:hypothetical protein n=1 Tax=Streptomyces sp. NPDC051310 TaxID=3365649 RepID=UPI00379A21E9